MKSKQTGIYESIHAARIIILRILTTCLTIKKRATNTIATWYWRGPMTNLPRTSMDQTKKSSTSISSIQVTVGAALLARWRRLSLLIRVMWNRLKRISQLWLLGCLVSSGGRLPSKRTHKLTRRLLIWKAHVQRPASKVCRLGRYLTPPIHLRIVFHRQRWCPTKWGSN